MGNDKRREVTNRIISLLEQTDISQGYPNLYQRIKEWIDEIPTEKAHDGDLLSRKDAIDALMSLPRWVIDSNGEYQPVDVSTSSMIDPDDAVSAIENLPPVQSEIIRCKDCKHSEFWYRDKRRCFLWHEEGIDVFEDGFCNYAERRTDE